MKDENNLKEKKFKRNVILILIIVSILAISIIFIIANNETGINFNKEEYKESFIGKDIVYPDRIVYRDKTGEYYEFKQGEEDYNTLKALIGNSITKFNVTGEEFITDEKIDEIHSKSFIEFDYKKASKNYLIQLETNDNQAVIKLADTGGNVVTKKLENINKIKKTLKTLTKNKNPQKLEYKELVSKNYLEYLEYKYEQLFKSENFKIHQVKIDNFSDYDKFTYVCNIAVDEEITEETFKENVIILTVSSVPKIDVKVNLGNIKYTYSRDEAYYGNKVHLLVVSRLVNTDCIYNTDLSEIESKIDYDNMKVEYNNSVSNIDKEVFVTNYDEFLEEYKKSNSEITQTEAEEIAEKGFEEAERICGGYEKSTQTVKKTTELANNFFSSNIDQGPVTYSDKIEVYAFTRVDDMDLNGVTIYVDTKLGKIIGGAAFGD